MENILVAGANGTTGKKVVDLLEKSKSFNPIAMIRKEEQKSKFESKGVTTVIGDLEEEISHVTKNIDKVVFAAGSGGKKVVEVDQEGAKKLIDVSKKSGIKKFVMLSSMGADNPGEADDLKEYLKAKHNADIYLKDSNLNFTIVRPGSLNNQKGSGKIILKNKLKTSGEISRDDVAETLVRSLHDNVANNAVFEILEGEIPVEEALQNIE